MIKGIIGNIKLFIFSVKYNGFLTEKLVEGIHEGLDSTREINE